jgi:hypothetical protein
LEIDDRGCVSAFVRQQSETMILPGILLTCRRAKPAKDQS